jgi:hypothetical protein
VTSRLGRRGAVLLIFGTIWCVHGIRLATDDRPRPGVMPLAELVPLPVIGAVWITVGLLGIAYAFRRGPDRDIVGFHALVGLSLAWSATYAWSWVLYLVPGPPLGAGHAWSGALIWAAAAALVIVCSGWAEAPQGYAPPAEDTHPEAT